MAHPDYAAKVNRIGARRLRFTSIRGRLFRLVPVVAAVLFASEARAQRVTPQFQYGNQEEVEKARYTVTIGAGVIVQSGNTNGLTFTGNGRFSRNDGKNLIAIEGNGTYGESSTLVGVDANGDGKLQASEIRSVSAVSAKDWAAKVRYDRFFGPSSSIYLAALAGATPLSGKDFAGGGQVGYSRNIVKDDLNLLTLEVGYDFSYESYLVPVNSSLQVHSLRTFASYKLQLAAEIAFESSVEGLFNLNPEETATGKHGVFEDMRINARIGLTAKIFRYISARLAFGANFDNVPAARSGSFSLPLDESVIIPASKLDTKTELALVVNFL